MYLWTTKDSLAELLFSALFHGEKWGVIFERFALEMPSEYPNIREGTAGHERLGCRCWWRRTSVPCACHGRL